MKLTSNGEVAAFECKNEASFNREEIERMAKTYITIKDLAGPFPLSDRGSLIKDSWNKLSFLYKRCYEKDSRFPSLQASLNELFLIENFEGKQYWTESALKYIKSSKFHYVVAFAGLPDRIAIQNLIKGFESVIKKYESSLSDFPEKLLFLSLSASGKIQNISQTKDYIC